VAVVKLASGTTVLQLKQQYQGRDLLFDQDCTK
jgi:hypothetical protein